MENLSNLPVNIFDIGVGVVLLISAILAYARGFVHETLAIAGWIGAIAAAIWGFPHAQPYAREYISVQVFADVAAGAVIFIVTLVILSVLTRAISRQVQASMLNALDRSLGFLFGLLRGALIVCVAYLGVQMMIPQDEQPDWVRNARSLTLVSQGAGMIRQFIPEHVGRATNDALGTAKKKAGDAAKDAAKKLVDPAKIVDELVKPDPKAEPMPEKDGYRKRQRQGLDLLIEGQGSGGTASQDSGGTAGQ